MWLRIAGQVDRKGGSTLTWNSFASIEEAFGTQKHMMSDAAVSFSSLKYCPCLKT
jgi:hypothetical protein